MLQNLKVQNFKRFKELYFPSFKRVNLLAGKNNSGKTGILEAIFLLLNCENVAQLPKAFRGLSDDVDLAENFWKWQFHDRDSAKAIIVAASTEVFKECRVALTYGHPFPGSTVLQSPLGNFFVNVGLARRDGSSPPNDRIEMGVVALAARPEDPRREAVIYDKVVLKAEGEERMERLLRKIEPRLRSIRTLKPYGASLVYVDIGLPERIPLVNMGEGFRRLLSIYSELVAGKSQVLLIDEVENGLHHSILIEVWRGLLNLAETEDVQIFATTHSFECIRAAHQAFAETATYDFALHRLEEIGEQVSVTTYDRQTLETSLANNYEVR